MKFLTKKQVSDRILYSLTHIDRLRNPDSQYYDPTFPKRVRIGNNKFGWLEDEIERYLQTKVANRSASD